MGKVADLSEFDRGQIVMARRLATSITETARLVGCLRSAVVSIHAKWTNDGDSKVLVVHASSKNPHSTPYSQGLPPVRTSREAAVSKGGRGGAKARSKDGHRKSNVRLN
ncbi:hypothetical protein AVEN_254205-1 [Araneus ventricosus]|uniref:Uncharacterized protein n=1 Tax=Araneus ventricosus TaxID=182803 RepID=A0A4Y2SRF6_ARAVE|nr:hypothetical protein AVEN_254205-1 [Araneus ventricosus]